MIGCSATIHDNEERQDRVVRVERHFFIPAPAFASTLGDNESIAYDAFLCI